MMRRVVPLVTVIVLTNLAILGSAWANRSGDPDATIVLTERELPLERASDRDSVRRLSLRTQDGGYLTRLANPWLTVEKLGSLGIVCRPVADATPASGGSCGLARRVFAAFEYDSGAWETLAAEFARQRDASPAPPPGAVSNPGALRQYYQNLIDSGSRLVSVDAAIDPSTLRRAYPDRRRYLILPVVVSAWRAVDRPATAPFVSSSIQPVTVSLIVPAPFGDRVNARPPSFLMKQPGYTVTVAVGRHLEPWIVAIDPIDTGAAPH